MGQVVRRIAACTQSCTCAWCVFIYAVHRHFCQGHMHQHMRHAWLLHTAGLTVVLSVALLQCIGGLE